MDLQSTLQSDFMNNNGNDTRLCDLKYQLNYNQSSMCAPFWDDLYCWPPTKLGELVSILCSQIFEASLSNYYIDHRNQISTSVAIRKCGHNGSWEWNNWTNYSQCFELLQAIEQHESFAGSIFATILRYMVLICSFVSTVALISSIVIFTRFEMLKCARNTVHKNLCISLLFQSLILMLLSSRALLTRNATADYSQSIMFLNSDLLCKFIKAVSIYASMTAVYWMFIEGLFLHTTLYFTPFAKNKHLMKLYYAVGWLIPFISLSIWISVSELTSNFVDNCWQGYGTSNLIWIITAPMIVALTLNFIFLINIIRLLTSKLREGLEKKKTMKTIKATAFLIPLLGLEHLIFCINPRGSSPELEGIYVVVNGAIQSLQGIAVSLLYCFTNNEVRRVIRNSWTRRRLERSNLAANSLRNIHSHLLHVENNQEFAAKQTQKVFL